MSISTYLIDVSPENAVATSAALAVVRFSSGALLPPLFNALMSVTERGYLTTLLIFVAVSTIPVLLWLYDNNERLLKSLT